MNKVISILFHYFRAKRRMQFTREELSAWQKKHLKKIKKFAHKYSEFYRQHSGSIITKKEMMQSFTSFNTRGIDKERALQFASQSEESRNFDVNFEKITVGLSSGTSGNRGVFLVSEKEKRIWCGNILARVLPKPPWKRQKIAFFLRANSPLYETVNSTRLSFRFFDLLENHERLTKEVKEYDPDILVAPPSMLRMLIGSCRPKKVISVAETLMSHDQKRLEEGFGVPIDQVYQCTEGFLGFTCKDGSFHLNEDLLVIEKEYLDENHFVPVITDLFRKTQPIIRYRLDDVLVEKKGICSCGCIFQAVERIEGRKDDLLFVSRLDGTQAPLFPDFVSRRILAASSEIEEYEVVQVKPNSWNIYVKPEFRIRVSDSLNDLFAKINCSPPDLVFVNEPLPRKLGEKLRRIQRKYENLPQ